MVSPREHIEFIRKNTFRIGEKPGPKDVFLHHAINYLSAELYTKDVHFLMELIQNAEDNEYSEGVQPSLEFVITAQDITATGAPATLVIFNNEKGFSPENIESICGLGCSTKKGNRKRGYIGEKGIGFKSVFLITAKPYVFSNGYQISFTEDPCPDCKVGFIVPKWVDQDPTLDAISEIYDGSSLPTTIFVLPLKPDKVKAVKQQLSSIHPEVLLFLSKIKRLSVKELNENPECNSVSAISILKETALTTRKNIDAESFLLFLSAEENSDSYEKECSYHMWRQRFPVKQENKHEKRKEVNEWVITLAFPNENRLKRGGNSPGVYAYLPTEMVTNFPFIMQADFLLPSSRETILSDNPWNKGILDCVPTAFVHAITSLVKDNVEAPLFNLPRFFEFLPVNNSPYPEMNAVRDSIKKKLANENIVPCESYMEQKFFRKPSEVGRLMPGFWNILDTVEAEDSVCLKNISSHGRCVLASSFDKSEHDEVLDFLGVLPMEDEWYCNCIRGSNLVSGVSDELYLDILVFLAEKWNSNFQETRMEYVPLIKYVSLAGPVSFCSIHDIVGYENPKVFFSDESKAISWLIDWNREFRGPKNCSFLPKSVQEEILGFSSKGRTLREWFTKVGIETLNVRKYASLIASSIKSDKNLVVSFAHFLHHSRLHVYLSAEEVKTTFTNMPIVDNYGQLANRSNGIIVPASGSKWVSLVGSNIWRKDGFLELGEDYLRARRFASVYTSESELTHFLKSGLGASDIPDIYAPDEAIRTLSAPLTKNNTFLLLDWIRNLKRSKTNPFPWNFLESIRNGSWMKVSMNGRPGYKPPSLSFFPSSTWGYLPQDGSILVDIPIMDTGFYGEKIHSYVDELKSIGVMFELKEACELFGKRVMSLVSSSALTRDHVYSILKFIKFLREKFLSPEDFIRSVKDGKWLITSLGYSTPIGSVLYDHEWGATLEMCSIPFISQEYYGEDIHLYKEELELLGVVVGFKSNYKFVMDRMKRPAQISTRTNECGLFLLKCLRNVTSPEEYVTFLKDIKFLKTNMGFKAPSESYFPDTEWGCLLQVFNSFPVIDEAFYGNSISSYKHVLGKLGVVLEFDKAGKAFASVFKQQAGMSSIGKTNVFSLLACLRKLNGTSHKFPDDFTSCIRETKWLRTRLGDYRAPKDCILFGPDWDPIATHCLLPFIDDSDRYYGKDVHEYKKEMKGIGVILDFKKGCKLVPSCLHFPDDITSVTPAYAYSLLECVRLLKEQGHEKELDSFVKKLGKNWLRTTFGYKSPNECLLFGPKWTNISRNDGPFIDQDFYGPGIMSYSNELNAIGVTVEARNGCLLLASHLGFHSDSDAITRIYNYLQELRWDPKPEEKYKIWVPNANGVGNWEKPEDCVLWDKDGLFAEQLNVLEKSYEDGLLAFFARALGVKSYPCLEDYCKLWRGWERSEKKISHKDCCAFWEFFVGNSGLEAVNVVSQNLSKLPVDAGSDEVLLVDKNNVFIADDLLLRDLFQQISSQLFVWFPRQSLASSTRFEFLDIYRKIGVRRLSESVTKDEVLISTTHGDLLERVDPSEVLIGKGLVSLVLGFLARPSMNMEPEKRQETVNHLLGVTVFETKEPVSVSYKLSLSSGEILETEAELVIRWERESGKMFAKKFGGSGGKKSSIIEYATYFSKVISEGLLWENEEWIEPLAELIMMGFCLDFDEEAIEFLMKAKNLELFEEDHEFISSVFPTA